MTIAQTIEIKSSAEKVYKALTTAAEFSEFTQAPAEISTVDGGAFSCFGGQIAGRHIELVPNERIVQAWRATSMWDAGVYSIVTFDISQSGDTTTLNLRQSGHPEDAADHLDPGWHKMYWDPLKAYLE
jgi:uncharacterized protein YndB with AHSA1/START domain